MINKNSFVKIMHTLRDYHDGMTALEKNLDVYFEENWMVSILEGVLGALFEDVEEDICPKDADSLLYEFAFTHDWGRTGDFYVEVDGKRRYIHSAAELYDFIEEERNVELLESL